MKTPRSVSWDDHIEEIVTRRRAEEHMSRSAYVCKCIREESERHRATSNMPPTTAITIIAKPKGMYRRGSVWWLRHTPVSGGPQVRVSLGTDNEQKAAAKAMQILAPREL